MGDWKVRKLGAALGAEITGGSLAKAGAHEIDLIKGWLAEHHVIFFPGQTISVEEHVERVDIEAPILPCLFKLI